MAEGGQGNAGGKHNKVNRILRLNIANKTS